MVFLTYTVWRKKILQIYVKPKANRPLIMDNAVSMDDAISKQNSSMRKTYVYLGK